MESNPNRKVLVIDDEAEIRKSFAFYLEDNDFDVILAENGETGIRMMADEQPDLVLLDLRMPKMDGLDVLKQGKHLLPHTPMIVVSGANRIGDVVLALRNGAWDYLEKPVQDFSILGHAVEKALEKARLKAENRAYQDHLESMVQERTQDLQRINSRLHDIVETIRRLAGCMEMPAFASGVLREFSHHMAATAASFYLVTDDALRLADTLSTRPVPRCLALPFPESSVFRSLETEGSPVIIENIANEPDSSATLFFDHANGALLGVPIRDGRGRFSGLFVLLRENGSPFSAQDREIGVILASLSAEIVRAIQAFETLKEREKQLRQSQKLEAIGTLAGGIAHDFNNILAGIMGFSELLQDTPEHKLSIHKIRDWAGYINKGTVRGKELVAQILAFTREEEGPVRPLNAGSIVKEAAKLLEASLPSTIDLITDISTDHKILARGTELHQVLLNLCTNAAHAMKDRVGCITISLEEICLDKNRAARFEEIKKGTYQCLSVEDTGHGMDDNILDRILTPFFTTKPEGEGTGMGLSTVHRIIKKAKGYLDVTSRPGYGSRFDVYFPVVDRAPETGGRDDRAPMGTLGGTEHILFIDDEQTLTQLAKEFFSDLGYRVTPFISAPDALAHFERYPLEFDLVVTDLTMPELAGDRLFRKIRRIRADIPGILTTGNQDTPAAAYREMFDMVLPKPVPFRKIATAIRGILDEKR